MSNPERKAMPVPPWTTAPNQTTTPLDQLTNPAEQAGPDRSQHGSEHTTAPSPRAVSIPATDHGTFGLVVVAMAVASVIAGYGIVHLPTGQAVNISGFSGPLAAKSWLTTAAMALAVVQLITATGMWGKLGLAGIPGLGSVHRWSGRLAVLITLPVAAHCLAAAGFAATSPRLVVHSVLGCAFYGTFTTKMLILNRPTQHSMALPLVGGLLLVTLTGLWLTAAVWYFATFGIRR